MKVWFPVLAFSVVALMAGASYAAGPPTACSSDLEKLCGGVRAGGGRLVKCLDQHRDKLSKPCAEALAETTPGAGAGEGGAADNTGKPARKGEETYTTVEFVVATGGDDLRGDSAAWALLKPPKHPMVTCMLHDGQGDPFANNSTRLITCELGAKLTLAQLRRKILIAYYGQPQGGFETQDNWTLNGVTIKAYTGSERPVCVYSASGNPLYRFQGLWTGTPGGDPGFAAYGLSPADDGVVVTDFPNQC